MTVYLKNSNTLVKQHLMFQYLNAEVKTEKCLPYFEHYYKNTVKGKKKVSTLKIILYTTVNKTLNFEHHSKITVGI